MKSFYFILVSSRYNGYVRFLTILIFFFFLCFVLCSENQEKDFKNRHLMILKVMENDLENQCFLSADCFYKKPFKIICE